MTTIVIAYHSGFHHTEAVALEVAKGVEAAGVTAIVHNVENAAERLWTDILEADGVIFGSPTYMAGVSAPFKAFMDASSKPWFSQQWKDKIAAGFTNSGSPSGDKQATLLAMAQFAGQHSMIWVSQGVFPSIYTGDGKGLNRLGSWLGMMSQSTNEPVGDNNPNAEDLGTARAFGERVAHATQRWVNGKSS